MIRNSLTNFISCLQTDLRVAPWEMMPLHRQGLVDMLARLEAADFMALFELVEPPKSDRFLGDVAVSESGKQAVVHVEGPLYSNVPAPVKQFFGLADLQDINHDVEELSRDSQVETVIFDIDTPGGLARPSAETAELIRELGKDKRTVAYSGPSSLMASAGYKLGSACHEIKASESADVGCIGTYIAMLDDSEAWAKEGNRLELHREGKYKAMGHPGKAITEDERELLAAETAECSKRFKDFVRGQRPGISESAMEGQTLAGRAAREAGLIDGTRRNLPLLIADEIRRSAYASS